MKEVTGTPCFEVWVDCPHCDQHQDVLTHCDVCEDVSDDLHRNRWDNVDAEITCESCEEVFLLTNFEM